MIDKTNQIKPNSTPILFINWTDKDFVGYWDGQPTKIRAGEKLWLPLWLAEHFAKHLTDRVLNERGVRIDDPSREALVSKCIGNTPDEKADDDPLGIKTLNANMAKEEAPQSIVPKLVKNKGGRPRKNPLPVDEDNFEGK